MKHSCKALVLHCIDFRLGNAIKKYLEKHRLLDNCDIVSVAGAAKNIVSPKKKSDKEFILRQIEVSKKLHGIKEVILMNHTDCGAYGGRDSFPSEQNEQERHVRDMKDAKALIFRRFPGTRVKMVLANLRPSGKIRIEVTT